jgi:hypothetical protein
MTEREPIDHKAFDPQHSHDCLRRWPNHRNLDEDQPDENYVTQCLWCAYFVPLVGTFSEDAGGCTNEKSPCDGRIMFEHDGCDEFVPTKYFLKFKITYPPQEEEPLDLPPEDDEADKS